jgi:hypothetical protein
MSRLSCLIAALCATVAIAGPAAAASERLNDKQLEQHIKDIDHGFDAWKKALEERNFDDAVIRSASGTLDVKSFLRDFEKDLERYDDRFKGTYGAVPEAQALLRRASDVDRRYRQQGGAGTSEWRALGDRFAILAAAYGAPWPLESLDVPLSRLNDKELASRVEEIERSAKKAGSEADKAAGQAKMDKARRTAMKQQFAEVTTTAKQVRQRLAAGRPCSAEVTALLAIVRRAGQTAAPLSIAPDGRAALGTMHAGGSTLAKVFGETW